MKRVLAYVGVTIVLAGIGVFVTAQLNLKTFTAGEVIRADEVNQNFQTLAAAIGSSQLPNECQAGEIAKWDGAAWTCAQDAVGEGGGGGDITGVTAGPGLTGGGASGDVTLALDTTTTDERYYQKAEIDARHYQKAEVDAAISAAVGTIPGAEVITPAGTFVPATLTVQRSYVSINDTFTSTQAGKLLISKFFVGSISCATASAGRYYFLTVDGEPVRSSTVYRPSTDAVYQGMLTGVTASSIPAGEHVLGIGAQCTNGDATSSGYTILSTSSIVVLPE